MKYFFNLFVFVFISFLAGTVNGQELNCRVTVDSRQISSGLKETFDALERGIYEFMNNRQWTTDKYKENERIEMNIIITLNEQSGENFSAAIQVIAVRPVYGASYKSQLFNHRDQTFDFQFQQFDVLDFAEQAATQSNLTAVLAYYAYLAIGFDYDSFGVESGTPYFLKAQNIVNQFSSQDRYSGWKAFENNDNRYWIVQNLLDPRFKGLRKCVYEYHRKGLDEFAANKEQAVNAITDALSNLTSVYDALPNSINLRMFFNAKAEEIVNIYSEAQQQQVAKVVPVLNKVDPSNSLKWNQMRKK